MNKRDILNAINQIKRSIQVFQTDLSHFNVLTELGSNAYLFSPLIPYYSGASMIYIWAKDSIYGKAEEHYNQFSAICQTEDIDISKFQFCINQFNTDMISKADLICNHSVFRPINKDFLQYVKKDRAVISLMYDRWEIRDKEIDLQFCLEHGLKVGGTDENHPLLQVFDSVGNLALKMAFLAGYEIYKNKIIVWSSDNFGQVISRTFLQLGASEVVTTNNPDLLYSLTDFDIIFFCDYHETGMILGNKSKIDLEIMVKNNPIITVIHLYGHIDINYLKEKNIQVYPDKDGINQVMSYTLAYLGSNPTLWLNSAGVKVGECLLKDLDHSLCQRIV